MACQTIGTDTHTLACARTASVGFECMYVHAYACEHSNKKASIRIQLHLNLPLEYRNSLLEKKNKIYFYHGDQGIFYTIKP